MYVSSWNHKGQKYLNIGESVMQEFSNPKVLREGK